MTHFLKCWPMYFEPVLSGVKTFELRRDDRPFAVGDVLDLYEWDPERGVFTGRSTERRVTYVLRGTEHLAPGYCVIGIAPT